MARRRLIVISGGFGNANSGDEALLVCEHAELSERFPDARIVAFTDDTATSAELFPDIEFCYSGRFGARDPRVAGRAGYRWIARMLGLLAGADVLITGGGTVLQDATHRFFVPFWFAKVIIAQLFFTPTVFYGVGAGPLTRGSSRLLMRTSGRLVKRFTTRGPLSERWILGTGVSADRVEVTADPAVRLVAATSGRVDEMLAAEDIALDPGRPVIGVCVREWYKFHSDSLSEKDWTPEHRRDYERMLDAYAGLVEHVVGTLGAQVLFVPMSIKDPNDDRGASDALLERLGERGTATADLHTVRAQLLPQEAKGLLGRCDAVFTMRFHPLVYATMQGIPVLGVGYGLKTDDYLEYFGLLEFMVHVDDVTAGELIERFGAMWDARDELAGRITETAERMRQSAARNVEMIAEVLGG